MKLKSCEDLEVPILITIMAIMGFIIALLINSISNFKPPEVLFKDEVGVIRIEQKIYDYNVDKTYYIVKVETLLEDGISREIVDGEVFKMTFKENFNVGDKLLMIEMINAKNQISDYIVIQLDD